MNEYAQRVLCELECRNARQTEFLQAAREVIVSLSPFLDRHPEYEHLAVLERFVEPERFILFRVPWMDDRGKIRVNRGFRVQYSSAIGPYKGGIRLHKSVTQSIIRFLGFEQVLKNALTGQPIGGGKGGSDFDPKGKSDGEVMRFCQSFMTELYRHIGADTDVPAGDIGTGAREIGFLYGQYKRITGLYEGVLTGKGLVYGGSLGRTEATGYGLCYFVQEMLGAKGLSFEGQRVVVSGSGNVATYAAEKAMQLGGKVVAMNDSSGYVVDEDGMDLAILKQIKQVERGRISEYAKRKPGAKYYEGSLGIWKVPCTVALPCATQNELPLDSAKALVANGVLVIAEGANMPTTQEATDYLLEKGILFGPGKAANAGGVAVSALEMSQNSQRLHWTAEEVDEKLKGIMRHIYDLAVAAAEECDVPGNFVVGANVAGFKIVAEAMTLQGAV